MDCINTESKHIGPLTELRRISIDVMTDEVVRWCPTCGAVVVDTEVDGRLQRGSIVAMQFPSFLFA
jgi:hypothetical protein